MFQSIKKILYILALYIKNILYEGCLDSLYKKDFICIVYKKDFIQSWLPISYKNYFIQLSSVCINFILYVIIYKKYFIQPKH